MGDLILTTPSQGAVYHCIASAIATFKCYSLKYIGPFWLTHGQTHGEERTEARKDPHCVVPQHTGYFSGFGTWGGVNQPLGVPSLPFSSPFPFPPPSPSLSPSFPPEAGGGVLCESWGVLTPPLRGVWETPCQHSIS